MTDLAPNDAFRQCTERGFVNTLPVPNGVVCYSRTTAGSEAVYVCDEGFHQDGTATRVCQNDSAWNDSMSKCSPNGRQDGKSVVSFVRLSCQGQTRVTNTIKMQCNFIAVWVR